MCLTVSWFSLHWNDGAVQPFPPSERPAGGGNALLKMNQASPFRSVETGNLFFTGLGPALIWIIRFSPADQLQSEQRSKRADSTHIPTSGPGNLGREGGQGIAQIRVWTSSAYGLPAGWRTSRHWAAVFFHSNLNSFSYQLLDQKIIKNKIISSSLGWKVRLTQWDSRIYFCWLWFQNNIR